MELLTAVLGGFVGALIGLLIALLGQSREDARLRRAEEWRQKAAKQERLRVEFATILRIVYAIDAMTGIFHWVVPSRAAEDPAYVTRLADLDALYVEARDADVRVRLEGVAVAAEALHLVAIQHQLFRDSLKVLDEVPRRTAEDTGAGRTDLRKAHEAISKVADTLDAQLAAYLDALTPPGPLPPPSGLRSWLREAEAWLRR
jgi:hypothetical protein